MKKYFLLLLVLSINSIAFSQNEKRHSIGVNCITAPFENKYIFGEYEFFFSDHASLSARLGYFEYQDSGDDYDETGSGLGWGATFRWYFGSKPMAGFLVGAGIEFFSYEWETTDGGFGSAFEASPNGQIGYRFNFGEMIYLTPMVVAGPTISIATDLESEAGVFVMPVVIVGIRL
jgi:hypothetical protein